MTGSEPRSAAEKSGAASTMDWYRSLLIIDKTVHHCKQVRCELYQVLYTTNHYNIDPRTVPAELYC